MADAVIRHLEVDGLKEACLSFKDSIQEFEAEVSNMQDTTRELLESWLGAGRNQFETEYEIIRRQLSDISDELYDIYDALVDAQAAYIDADEAVAKEITTAQEG